MKLSVINAIEMITYSFKNVKNILQTLIYTYIKKMSNLKKNNYNNKC